MRVPPVDRAAVLGLEGLVDLTAAIGDDAMIACAPNAFAVEPTSTGPPRPV